MIGSKSTCPLAWTIGLTLLAIMLLTAPIASAMAADHGLQGYTQGYGWQYVELGVYPQTLEGGLEPILWRVLSAENGKAYLLSEYVLLNHRIDPDDATYVLSGGDFTKTEMYTFLNGAFLASFSNEELSMLVDDPVLGRITLLSADDLRNAAYGFASDAARMAVGTPWALQNGLYQYGLQHGNTSPYWTRTQHASATYGAICTKASGNLGYIRVVVQNEGCRPACTLMLDKVEILRGSGTKADPLRLSLN